MMAVGSEKQLELPDVTEQPDTDVASTDHELLKTFVVHRDEGAFRALVEKHSRLVWGVCSRQLRCHEDIEDAFQSTFTVLAQKAHVIRSASSVASWLYKVAYRMSLQTRQTNGQGSEQSHIKEPAIMDSVSTKLQDREQAMILDEEVARLPERLREVVALCCIDGKSRTEAARELGCTVPTVKSRLARGRRVLRDRLQRRGIVLSVVLAWVAGSAKRAGIAPPASAIDNAVTAGIAAAMSRSPMMTFIHTVIPGNLLSSSVTAWGLSAGLVVAALMGIVVLAQLPGEEVATADEVAGVARVSTARAPQLTPPRLVAPASGRQGGGAERWRSEFPPATIGNLEEGPTASSSESVRHPVVEPPKHVETTQPVGHLEPKKRPQEADFRKLLSSRFHRRRLPAWIREGTANMDAPTTESLAVTDRIPLATLLDASYEPTNLVAFRKQSHSVVQFLLARQQRHRTFIDFVEQGLESGDWEGRLCAVYEFPMLDVAETNWLEYATRKTTQKRRLGRAP